MTAAQDSAREMVDIVVLHGGEQYYERIGFARKFFERGLRVACAKEIRVNTDLKRINFASLPKPVVVIRNDLRVGLIEAIREEAKLLPAHHFYYLDQRTSSESWQKLTGLAADIKRVVEKPDASAKSGALESLALVGKAIYQGIPEGSKPSALSFAERVAKDVTDNEELAKLAMSEAEEAKKDAAKWRGEVEELRGELEQLKRSSGAVARDQLAQDVARKESERAEAVRQRAAVERDLTARLEACEKLRREARSEPDVLRKVRTERDQLAAELLSAREELVGMRSSLESALSRVPAAESLPLAAGDDPRIAKIRRIAQAEVDGVLTADEAWSKVKGVL